MSAMNDMLESEFRLKQEIKSLRQQLADSQKQIVMLRNALIKVEGWAEHSPEFRLDYGSDSVRDIYRQIAREALAAKQAEVDAQATRRHDTERIM